MHAHYCTFIYMCKRVLGDVGCKTEVQLQNPMSIQPYTKSMVPLRFVQIFLKAEFVSTDFLWNAQQSLKSMGILY